MELRRTTKEIFFTFGFYVYLGLIGYIINILLARIVFSAEEFGRYNIIMKYIMIMHTCGLLGLDIAGINYMSNKKIPGSVLSQHILPFSFLSGLLFFLVAWALFPFIYGSSPSINLLFYSAIPFNLLLCVVCALLLGSNHILSYNIVTNVRDTLYVVFIIVFAIGLGGGYSAAASTYILSTILSFIISLFFLHRFSLLSGKQGSYQVAIIKELLNFGKFTYISDVLWFLVLRLDILMVGYFLGEKSAGIYGVASQLADIMRYLPRALNVVIMPKIPTFAPDKTKRIIVLLSKSLFLILTLILAGVYFFGEKIIQYTYSVKYSAAFPSLILLTPGVLFLGISQILSGYYVAKGYVKIFIPISASALIVDVVLVILFVPEYGLPAAAIASSISYFISFLVCLAYFFRKEHLKLRDLFITSNDIKRNGKGFEIIGGKVVMNEQYPFSPGFVSDEKLLGNWYFDYSKIADRIANGYYGSFDEKGIPLVDYSSFYKKCKIPITGESGGFYYTPVTIAHYGLGNLWKYNQSQNSDNLQIFVNCAEWFCNNVVRREDYGVWEHLWMEPTYNLNPPWVSAMAQGEALSLLLRAFQCTNAQVFFDSADLAYNSFYVPVKNGGITLWDSDGHIWFEEYPSSPPCYVLNGFIFAVLGLYDYYRVTGDEKCRKLWLDAITSLNKRLPLYDTGYWSEYDLLTNNLTSPEYHFLHILQLEVLSALTGDEVLRHYSERWKSYQKSNYCRLRREIGARSTRQYWQNVLKRVMP